MEISNRNHAEKLFVSSFKQEQQLMTMSNSALKTGMDLYQKEDYKDAAKAFQRAIDLAPRSQFSADASNYLAMTHLKLNDPDKAIEAYKKWIKLNSDQADPHIKLGNLYFSQEQYKESEKEYAEAVRIDPNANNLYSLAQAYLFQDRFSEAEAHFREVRRLEPKKPNGYYGLGLAYSRQGQSERAIELFDEAIGFKRDFFDAYAEKGYAYADLDKIEEAQKIFEFLEDEDSDLADTLSRYIYKVDPPQIAFGSAMVSTFSYRRPRLTSVSDLDSYLENANASKSFTMVFQFDKEMDRLSVEDRFNWKINRARSINLADTYNFGLTVPSTEIQLSAFPDSVYYDSEALTAKVTFTIQQNETADGTIDPSHIEFKFVGEDAYGLSMDREGDQFTGFSGVF